MKKFLSLVFLSFILNVSAQDFQSGGLTYTVLDETAKTCETKAGSVTVDVEGFHMTITYGNTVEGSVSIPEKVTNGDTEYAVVRIGECGFHRITSIELPASLTEIGRLAFYDCTGLTEMTIPSSVTKIDESAFDNCRNLKTINLPDGLSKLEYGLFNSCFALENLEIPSSVTEIGKTAFFECKGLKSLIVPASVSKIGESAFYGCTALEEIELSDALTQIEKSVFYYCRSLKSITIPASVTSIDEYSFASCASLTEVNSLNPVPPVVQGNSFMSSKFSSMTLNVKKTAISAYQKANYWKNFGTIQAIPTAATSISLNNTSAELTVGQTLQLTATVVPADATETVTWSVTPAEIASVSETGKVTALSPGTAVVSAVCGSVKAECNLTVNPVNATSVTIDDPGRDIFVGDVLTLTAKVLPANTTDKRIVWSSGNTDVAVIDAATGELTAVAPGASIITADCGGITGKYVAVVNAVEAQSIVLNETEVKLKALENVSLTATVMPANTTYPTVTWSSSDNNVAIVIDGVVTGLSIGSATITATCGQAVATCEVIVEPTEATSIELNKTEVTLKATQVQQLIATIMPETTTDMTVSWSSDNETVATVSDDGMVTAVAVGTANITGKCGSVSAVCVVIVEKTLADEIVLNMIDVVLRATQTQQLTATVPDNVTDKTIEWKSSDDKVATVTSNGLVTAVAVGEAVITASCGLVEATCDITVEPTPIESISLNKDSIAMNVKETVEIQAAILPVTTTDTTVTWTSTMPDIASVENGTVTALAPGEAVIIASSGNLTAVCVVTVYSPAESIELNCDSITISVNDIDALIATISPATTTDVLIWESSDTTVATVDVYGIVTGIAPGEAVITAICGEQTAYCYVSVVADEDENPDNGEDGPDGIEKVELDFSEGPVDIYSISGICLKRNASREDINSLEPGLYIIGGKKLLIRR